MDGAPKITKIIDEPIHATRLMKIMVLGFKTFDTKIPESSFFKTFSISTTLFRNMGFMLDEIV